MKKIIVMMVIIASAFLAKGQGFPGTDSLRVYNIKYTTNNPATAFTNLRLHTLLRGIIDWIDTARAGSGGGGALGIDTLYALNDSTIRYRRNGLFQNHILKGVYDTRRKVDTAYALNDTTLRITINGLVRNIILPGRGGGTRNLATASLTANDDYTHNWAQRQLYIDSIRTLRMSLYAPNDDNPSNNFRFNLNAQNSLVTPFALEWGLTDISGSGGDSAYGGLISSSLGTTLQQFHAYGNKFSSIDLNGGFNTPHINIEANDQGFRSKIYMDRSVYIQANDSTHIQALPAVTADSTLGIRKTRNVFGYPVSTVVKFPIPKFGLTDNTATSTRSFNANNNNFFIDSFPIFSMYSKVNPSGVDRGVYSNLTLTNGEVDLWNFHSNGTSTRSFGFTANGTLTQMFAVGHAAGHSGFVQADTSQVILESDPNRFYLFHDSAALIHYAGGTMDFRIRTLPLTIDTTNYKPLAIGPLGKVQRLPGWPGSGGGGAGTLDAVLALGGRFSTARNHSMGHNPLNWDSAALRLRSVDSTAIGIDLAKAGDIIRINKPEGAARTYPGSTPFKFLMENTTDNIPTMRNNPVKWGWNVNCADSSNAWGIWWSMEPNYRPATQQWMETHLEVKAPSGAGSIPNSRLLSSTFIAGDSIRNSTHTWDFRGNNINFFNLANDLQYFQSAPGLLNVNNNTSGSTDFSISNGSDVSLFTMSPGTGNLDYSGPKFRVNGSINFALKNGNSGERELIAFEGDGGTTGYVGKYNSAWAPQPHLQNGMIMMAANGTPTETMLLLKPDGTAWLGDLDTYNSGSHKINISGSMALRGIGKATTAPEILVRLADSTQRAMDTADFRTMMGIGSGSGGNGIYGGNGSLPSNVTVTGGNNSITFDDIFAFKINSDYNVIAKANGTGIYTEAVIGTPNTYEIGYTPTPGVYSKGAGIFIDTNNNVGIGTQPPTTMPLYSTGASLFVQGLQSNHGNYFKVTNITSDITASLQAYFYTIDASGGNVTVTLPAASSAFGNTMGITYKFQRTDNSGNTVTIQRAGSDTINGSSSSLTITTQWTQIKQLQCTSASTWAAWE